MAVLTSALGALMALTPRRLTRFVLTAETEPQAGIIMAWPTEFSIVNETYPCPKCKVRDTRQELAEIAKTIAKYEPVKMFVRDARVGEPGCGNIDTNSQSAQEMLRNVANFTIHLTPNVHSLWARDAGPVFVRSHIGPTENKWESTDDPGVGFDTNSTSSTIVGLLLNYNNWGRKTLSNADSYFAAYAAQALNKPSRNAPFVAEGGGLEVDGDGTLLATDSSILNPNRNPGIDKTTMESYFSEVLGVEKTIWLPGYRGDDITDDHIDSLARFVSPGTVILNKPFDEDDLGQFNSIKSILSKTTDAKGRTFKIVELTGPDPEIALGADNDPDLGASLSYVNYLVLNGAVIMAKFGDREADEKAKRVVQDVYRERVVEQVYLHEVAMQGGGIHCATQNIPA